MHIIVIVLVLDLVGRGSLTASGILKGRSVRVVLVACPALPAATRFLGTNLRYRSQSYPAGVGSGDLFAEISHARVDYGSSEMIGRDELPLVRNPKRET